MKEFIKFPKIPRLKKGSLIVTEKIDGTNAQILITEKNELMAGSRNRWLTLEHDNYGFARWCKENEEVLLQLGAGRHYGEWWGQGIQRRYNADQKYFSLFNTSRWKDNISEDCLTVGVRVVPLLGVYDGFQLECVEEDLRWLLAEGSVAMPGYSNPEGIVVFHTRSGQLFKMTEEDNAKGL